MIPHFGWSFLSEGFYNEIWTVQKNCYPIWAKQRLHSSSCIKTGQLKIIGEYHKPLDRPEITARNILTVIESFYSVGKARRFSKNPLPIEKCYGWWGKTWERLLNTEYMCWMNNDLVFYKTYLFKGSGLNVDYILTSNPCGNSICTKKTLIE